MFSQTFKRGVLLDWRFAEQLDFSEYETTSKREGDSWVEYYNIPCAYDIETTSFRDRNGNKAVITYTHALNIDGYVFVSRTWDEFHELIDIVKERAGLRKNVRLVLYVHNLSYEFGFLRRQLNFDNVFSNGKEHNILYAQEQGGLEFRCSAMLAGSNLATMAKNLLTYKIRKLDGDLDYKVLRSPLTPLSDKEWEYVLNDVLIIEYYIREQLDTPEVNGNITRIPMTQTGFVRNYCRKHTISGQTKEARRYRDLMNELTITEDELLALQSAFAGGFTHANAKYSGLIIDEVSAQDFASSYPARMFAHKYPMSKGELYDLRDMDEFAELLESHCCLFYVEFEGMLQKANEGYISASKAVHLKGHTENNGRVYSAERLGIWITEVDFKCIMASYSVADFQIGTFYKYLKGYLPTEFIKAVMHLYENKTKYKGLDEFLVEYNMSKAMLNSTYGMCVMNILQSVFHWDDGVKTHTQLEPDIEGTLAHYNNSKKRFLYYPWGVWITAHARHDLFMTILALGDDYVYADTDSIYYIHALKNQHIFDAQNEQIKAQLMDAADHHGLDYSVFQPADPNGVIRTIGVWDFDGHYKKFKTLGAKRYMTMKEKDGEKVYNLTVSGVNKHHAMPYLVETYGERVFEEFTHDLQIPEGKCGKMTHKYIPWAMEGTLVDCNGVSYDYLELSGIHLEETNYRLTLSKEYTFFMEFIQR